LGAYNSNIIVVRHSSKKISYMLGFSNGLSTKLLKII